MKKIFSLSFCILFSILIFALSAQAQTGNIRLVINPAEVRDAGAQWRVAGQAVWLNSGDTVFGLDAGQHEVEFSDVAGWITPDNLAVTILSGQTVFEDINYLRAPAGTGNLQITLEPQEARDAGAMWRRAGQTEWRESGSIEFDIPVGIYDLEFRSVGGWVAPQNQRITITADSTRQATYSYSRSPGDETGNLQVTLEPQEARDAGAMWRRAGQTEWRESGSIEFDIPVGIYDLEFREIEGWAPPVDQRITIIADETRNVSYTYRIEELTGSLIVNITPVAALDAGAQWRRYGTEPWFSGGDIEINIPAGDHLIEFSSIVGWARPTSQVVTIVDNETTVLDVEYLQGGTLQVFLEPLEARQAGAGWRIAGVIPDNEEGWYTDDLTTLDGLRPGNHTIEFNAIPGWIKPENMSVTVYAGQTTYQSGRYVISTEAGSLRVFIEPSPAPMLGAMWRRVGTDVWLASGELEKGFPEGTYTIEFKFIPGWGQPGNKAVSIHRGDPPVNLIGYYNTPQPGVRVMNWLESVLPEILPTSGMQVHTPDDWYIRYYPATKIYLGAGQERLYFYAQEYDRVIDLGRLDAWLPSARESGF